MALNLGQKNQKSFIMEKKLSAFETPTNRSHKTGFTRLSFQKKTQNKNNILKLPLVKLLKRNKNSTFLKI